MIDLSKPLTEIISDELLVRQKKVDRLIGTRQLRLIMGFPLHDIEAKIDRARDELSEFERGMEVA